MIQQRTIGRGLVVAKSHSMLLLFLLSQSVNLCFSWSTRSVTHSQRRRPYSSIVKGAKPAFATKKLQSRPDKSTIFQIAATLAETPGFLGQNASQTSASTSGGNDLPPPSLELKQQYKLDMPWSEIQAWSLRDKIGAYTTPVPITLDDGTQTIRPYTLWRSLGEGAPELAGYPLSFLMERYLDDRKNNETMVETTLEILPFLDAFTFESNGGLSGRLFGVPGLAEGTRIQTTPVSNVEISIPKGYVCTSDGKVVYELGRPAQELYQTDALSTASTRMVEQAAKAWPEAQSSLSTMKEPFWDPDLVNLGALTALVVGGATAMQSLAHHLTVNIFWV